MSEEHYNALPAGYTLHEYTIKSVLGHGGFGITYLAGDENLGIDVAIKEYLPAEFAVRQGGQSVRPRSTGDAEDYQWGLDRFMLEAQTLALFRHPSIVPVFRFFRENGTAYMVMEYQKGDSLASLMRKHRGEFTESDLMGLVRPILEGLAEVHKAGYLHRDVKPGNIFIRENGTPVLLDFGAARSAVGRKSKNLTSIVTPGYAPLEQYFADGNQGPWTDIYSMSAILYQATVGRIPPEAPARVKKDPITPAVDAAKGKFSQHFLASIDLALSVEEEERPQTTADWLAMMTGAIPVAPPAAPVAEPLEPPPDATIIAGGFGASGGGADPGGANGVGAGGSPPADPDDRPPPSFRRPPTGAPAEAPSGATYGVPSAGPSAGASANLAAAGGGGGGGGGGDYAPVSEAPRRKGAGLKIAAIAAAAVFLIGLSAAGAWLVISNQEQTELADKRKQEEIARLKEEEAKRLAAEEARRKAEEEAKRKASEEAKRKAEEAKRQAEEEAKRKASEEARRQAEAEARRKAEEEAKRKAAEEARRKAAEEEARRKAEAERQKKIEEARRKAEEERKRKLEEARRNESEQERRRREEEDQRKAEEERRRKLEEARRNESEQERRRAEEEARRKAAEDARRRAEEERRRKAAEEAKRKAEEERKRASGGGVSCPGSLGGLNGLYASRRECFFVFRVFSNALTTGTTGSTSQWRNSRSGSRGTLTILRSFQRKDGVYCRRFQQTIITGRGVSRRAVGTACLFNSRWKITAG